MSPGYSFNNRSKVKVTVQKHISSDRVASVSLHSVEWPETIFVLKYSRPIHSFIVRRVVVLACVTGRTVGSRRPPL